ncbi:MAG TPA: AAA family ATPase [Gemmatimonadaceae bacterium]|nr:AAA family ATPase [Gemmatimonadaceae bacterium]
MRGHITVRTLGTAEIEVGKRRLGPSSGRPFALLLYLALHRGQATSRRVVQELLFPEANGHAAHNLRQLLYRLRQLGVPMDTDADQLRLRIEDVSVDWWPLAEAGLVNEPELEQLAQGFFPGYSPDVSDAFREWFEAERAEICLRLSRQLTRQLAQLRASGRWDLVDAAARALLALDPLSEEGTLARAEVLAAAGSKSAALGVIDQYLIELGEAQPQLRLAPSTLKRRISERLPEAQNRSLEDRMFVGREQMMRMLYALGRAARCGEQQILLLWGEPGIGKTRLLSEYRALASLQGALTLLFSCQTHDVYRPLGTACDMTAQLLQAPGALGCDPDARALLERLVSTKTVSTVSPTGPAAAEAPLSAIVRSLADLVGAVASECPVVVVVDDAQWLDEGSLRTLFGVFGDRAPRRSCLILASRDRTLLTTAGSSSYTDSLTSVRLNPLERDAALELIRSLLKPLAGEKVDAVEQQVVDQGRGNPFFIRLLCQHFVSTNDTEALKQTLTELLQRRLEQLSPEATRTLEACVVLAKNCSFRRLEKVLEIPRHQLLRAIEELDDRGLIEVSDGFIVSSHALLSDAVDRRMAPSVKSMLHASVAAILQQEIDSSSAGHLQWDCAEHWRLAGDDERAASVLRRCANDSIRIGRASDANATYMRMLSLKSTDAARLEIVEAALLSLDAGVSWKDAEILLEERKVLRRRLQISDSTHDHGEIVGFSKSFREGRAPEGYLGQLTRCVTARDASERHKLSACRQLIMLAEMTLDPAPAEFAYRVAMECTAEPLRCAMTAMMFHTCFGSPAEAKGLASLVFDQTQDDPAFLPYVLNSAYAESRIGNWEVAEARFHHGLELARRGNTRAGEMHARFFLARMYYSIGRYDAARTWYNNFTELLSEIASEESVWEHNLLGARLAAKEGNLDLARHHLAAARASKFSELPLPTLFTRSCDLALRLSQAFEPSTVELEELLALYQRSRTLGFQDDTVRALFGALQFHQRPSEATTLISEYLASYRRDGYPPDPGFLALAHQDYVAASIQARSTGHHRTS